MKKQLQGIALILFAILFKDADWALDAIIARHFSLFPFPVLGLCIGLAGLVLVFSKEKPE